MDTPEERGTWRDLYRLEDWWAIWLGLLLLALVFAGAVATVPIVRTWEWPNANGALPAQGALGLAAVGACLYVVFSLALAFVDPKAVRGFAPAFFVLFALAALALLLGNEKVVKYYELSYALWAVGIGLLIANTVGLPAWLGPAMRSEFYIKTGLVLMGAEVMFGNILRFGAYGLAIGWIVPPTAIIFMWWYGTRVLKMTNKPFVIVMAAATSVCGVSAAIAAAAASKAKKEDLTVAISMSLIFTVLMMVIMPVCIKAMGMSPAIGGAWIGGTIDSTGAVVAAGAALGPEAEAVAAIVKMIQNLLIGVIAFGIAVFWVVSVERTPGAPRPGAGEMWLRLPKFVLGFVGASLLVSFVLIPWLGQDTVDGVIKQTKNFREWLFCLAFLCVGLESNFKEMASYLRGGKPFNLYIVGQTFNLVLTLLIAWLVLSGTILPPPPLLAP
jgi:uncharacterized integral membrane protein (TIGR00698 family)